jgi:hypothetical protein
MTSPRNPTRLLRAGEKTMKKSTKSLILYAITLFLSGVGILYITFDVGGVYPLIGIALVSFLWG